MVLAITLVLVTFFGAGIVVGDFIRDRFSNGFVYAVLAGHDEVTVVPFAVGSEDDRDTVSEARILGLFSNELEARRFIRSLSMRPLGSAQRKAVNYETR